MTSRKWKAFMRLTGETMDGDRGIVKDFTGFAKELERVGVEYSIVVSVDKGPIRQYSAKTNRLQPIVGSGATTGRQIRSEGD